MVQKVFYSFYYKEDASRIQQVINMGAIEGQPLLTGQKWEEIERGGNAAIEKWINDQMRGKDCLVVLIGANTASRPWVKYEIKKAWTDKLGVVGVRIHGLKGLTGFTSSAGRNPFMDITVGTAALGAIVKAHEPFGSDSKAVYANINTNIETWVKEAIQTRKRYS
jgi:hypothetical protein